MDFMESSISLKGNRRSGFVLDTGHERSGTCTSTYELDSFIKEDELPPHASFWSWHTRYFNAFHKDR